jgi:hypothetical protein
MNLRFRCALLAWVGASFFGATACGSVPTPASPGTGPQATSSASHPSAPTPGQSSDGPGPTASPTSGETSQTTRNEPLAENQVRIGLQFQASPGASGPAPFDFGIVQVGRRTEMPIRVTNHRSSDVSAQPVSVITTRPAGGSDFVLSADGCQAVLHPGDSCILKVAFEPTGLGTRSGRLEINGARVPSLTGEGTTSEPGETSESSDTSEPSDTTEPGGTSEPTNPSEPSNNSESSQ